MSYVDGEDSILDLVRLVSGFDASNTSIGDWGILNTGKSRTYAILKPGEFDRNRPAPRAVGVVWATIIQVWVRYKNDGESLRVLEQAVANLLTKLDQYPHLGNPNVIQEGFAKRGSDVQEMWKRGGSAPIWLRQDLTVIWSEQTAITLLD